MNLEEAINIFDANVVLYFESPLDEINQINEAMKNISVALVYMTKERVELNQKFEELVMKYANEGMSNAAARNQASNEVPQLYKVRRVQETGRDLLKTIISHYSKLKQELQR